MLPSLLALCVQFGIQATRAELAVGGTGVTADAVGGGPASLETTLSALCGATADGEAADAALGGSTAGGGEQWIARHAVARSKPITDLDSM